MLLVHRNRNKLLSMFYGYTIPRIRDTNLYATLAANHDKKSKLEKTTLSLAGLTQLSQVTGDA